MIGAFMIWTAPMVAVAAIVVLGLAVLGAAWVRHRRASAARALAEHADIEHAAMLRGETGIGVYGQFQPPKL